MRPKSIPIDLIGSHFGVNFFNEGSYTTKFTLRSLVFSREEE